MDTVNPSVLNRFNSWKATFCLYKGWMLIMVFLKIHKLIWGSYYSVLFKGNKGT